jgi:hypothetical protein
LFSKPTPLGNIKIEKNTVIKKDTTKIKEKKYLKASLGDRLAITA